MTGQQHEVNGSTILPSSSPQTHPLSKKNDEEKDGKASSPSASPKLAMATSAVPAAPHLYNESVTSFTSSQFNLDSSPLIHQQHPSLTSSCEIVESNTSMQQLRRKPTSPPVMTSEAVQLGTLSAPASNPSLQSIIAERKRLTGDHAIRHIEEEAASERLKQKNSELLQVMQARKKKVDRKEDEEDEDKEVMAHTMAPATAETLGVAKENNVQKMAAKWEKGAPSPPRNNEGSPSHQPSLQPQQKKLPTPRSDVRQTPPLSSEGAESRRREQLAKQSRSLIYQQDSPSEDESEATSQAGSTPEVSDDCHWGILTSFSFSSSSM